MLAPLFTSVSVSQLLASNANNFRHRISEHELISKSLKCRFLLLLVDAPPLNTTAPSAPTCAAPTCAAPTLTLLLKHSFSDLLGERKTEDDDTSKYHYYFKGGYTTNQAAIVHDKDHGSSHTSFGTVARAGCVPQLVRERNSPCAGEVACTNSLYFDNGPEHLHSPPVVAPSPTPLGVNKHTINRGKNGLSCTLEGVLETCNQTH